MTVCGPIWYTFLDMEENRIEEREKTLYRDSHDPLTGIYNREGFFRAVRERLDAERGRVFYLVRVNIRDFKLVNQLFGFERGDEVLRETAEMLSGGRLLAETAGRIHSDHFAILIREENFSERSLRACFRILSGRFSSMEYALEYRVGIYKITDPETDVSIMSDRANVALSSIGSDSLQLLAYYDESMMSQILMEKEILSEFQFALKERRFRVYLQPIVRPDGTLDSAEALVRWVRSKEEKVAQPVDFIAILEKTGLIHEMDTFVWEEAARILRSWKGTPLEKTRISVNISPKDVFYVDLEATFSDLVELYDISPERLNLEFTETMLMTEPSRYIELISRLRGKGFRVEIDDFGSGYSSLNMLKDIVCDTLKIDMEFLKETQNRVRSRIIMESVVNMSRKLGMQVIAEGVESGEQRNLLTQMNCDLLQGYYFAKPMPVEEFEEQYGT